jgi:hypothetical protein
LIQACHFSFCLAVQIKSPSLLKEAAPVRMGASAAISRAAGHGLSTAGGERAAFRSGKGCFVHQADSFVTRQRLT